MYSRGDRDVPVSSFFSDAWFAELRSLMEAEGWEGLDRIEQLWKEDYGQRNIISGFLRDKNIGHKRLASWVSPI